MGEHSDDFSGKKIIVNKDSKDVNYVHALIRACGRPKHVLEVGRVKMVTFKCLEIKLEKQLNFDHNRKQKIVLHYPIF